MQFTAIALLTTALSLQAAAEVQLLPAGEFKGRDGRPGNGLTWKLSDDKGRALAARLNASHTSVRFNVDYEHQAMLTEKNGQPAPASGWGTKFEWRDGQGLFVLDMQWTARAKQMIESGEYKYISPVIVYNKQTGEVNGVVNAALVNIPALDISPVAQDRIERLNARYAQGDGAEEALSDEERAVCRATGVDASDFLATRTSQQRGSADDGLTDWERAICRATGIDASAFLETREQAANKKPPEGGESLSDEQLAVCRAMGIQPSDFVATLKQQTEEAALRAAAR